MSGLPSPLTLNRVIANQRRALSQQQKVRPGKVPFRDPKEEDQFYDNQNQKSPRPQTSTRIDGQTRKDQLQTILNKEKLKERKERIQAVLVQRLATKYGTQHISLISFFVEEFLSTHDEVNSTELNILEKEIQNAIRLKNLDEQTSARYRRNDSAGKNTNNNEATKADSAREKKITIDTNANTIRPPSGKEWQVLQVYQSILDEDEVRREKEKLKNQKLQFRHSLDEHLKEAQKLSNIEKEVDNRYLEHVKRDLTKYEEEEKRKQEYLKKKHNEELNIRQQQIQEQRKRLEDERKALEAIDLANLNLAKQKAKEEQDFILQQKLKEKEKLQRFKLENEENKRLKLIEKQKEAEYAAQLMAEYSAKLDREEKEREELFAKKLKEMEIYAKKFENEGAGKIAKEEQIRFEQQLLREQQRKLDEDLRKEREKEEQRKRSSELANQENARQLAQRKQIAQEEKEKDLLIKQQYREEERAFHDKERALLEKRRQLQDQYRHLLDIQREELSKFDINLTGITPIEKKLNASTLNEITTNPETLNRVMGRMKFTSKN